MKMVKKVDFLLGKNTTKTTFHAEFEKKIIKKKYVWEGI